MILPPTPQLRSSDGELPTPAVITYIIDNVQRPTSLSGGLPAQVGTGTGTVALFPICDLCGSSSARIGWRITIQDAVVSALPASFRYPVDITCETLEVEGLNGKISPENCTTLTRVDIDSCGCAII